jgi:hypothetical protein
MRQMRHNTNPQGPCLWTPPGPPRGAEGKFATGWRVPLREPTARTGLEGAFGGLRRVRQVGQL